MQIRDVFKQAFCELEPNNQPTADPAITGWADVQADGQNCSMPASCSELSAILDLEAAVGRSQAAHQVKTQSQYAQLQYLCWIDFGWL